MSIENQIGHLSLEENAITADPVTRAVNEIFWESVWKDFSDEETKQILGESYGVLQAVSDHTGGLWNSIGIIVDRLEGTLELTQRGEAISSLVKDPEAVMSKRSISAVISIVSGAFEMLQYGATSTADLKNKKDIGRNKPSSTGVHRIGNGQRSSGKRVSDNNHDTR